MYENIRVPPGVLILSSHLIIGFSFPFVWSRIVYCMKVINESDSFKGHAESADLVQDAMINCDINRCATQSQGSAK